MRRRSTCRRPIPSPTSTRRPAALDAFAAGAATAATPIYGRLHNPTVARFEEGLAALEGAEEAVAYGSGMAAITAVLLAACAHGRHVVAVRPLYGGTDHLLASGILGIEASFVGVHEVAGALRPDTALVLVETPGNPTLSLVDIADVVRQAGAVPVAVDSTFATPVLQRPLAHGATYSIHSATKFLSGHGDVIAGVVACSAAAAAGLRQLRILTGALLHPWAAYLLHRSLPTLPLRVRRAQESAGQLATQLAAHPGVTRVLYPGLPGGDPDGLLGRQMSGPGAILAFEVEGGAAAARLVLQNVKTRDAGGLARLDRHPDRAPGGPHSPPGRPGGARRRRDHPGPPPPLRRHRRPSRHLARSRVRARPRGGERPGGDIHSGRRRMNRQWLSLWDSKSQRFEV